MLIIARLCRHFFLFAPCVSTFLFVFLFEHAVLAAPVGNKNFTNTSECPRIINRKEWRARKRIDCQILPITPTPYVVVHHGGIRRYCNDQESCSAIVRSYQDFHMDDRGWWDIGYNFLIGEDGNAYEGRGWNFVGAHAPGYNTQSIGICILGDFSDFLPNSSALKTLNELIACGVALGKISDQYNVIGHRQARNTECPGETLYNYVANLSRWTAHPVPIRALTTTTSTAISTTQGTPLKNPVEENDKLVAALLGFSQVAVK